MKSDHMVVPAKRYAEGGGQALVIVAIFADSESLPGENPG
jgi:hypothetical protein